MTASFNDAFLAALLSSWASLLLDGLLLFLLLCAVLYAVRLSRAVGAIHRGKAELAWLFARFAENIARAENLLEELKRSALESQEAYMRRKEETDRLTNDLGYLIEKGNGMADHLEETIGAAKNKSYRNTRHEKSAVQKGAEGEHKAALSMPNLHNLR